MFLKYLFTHEHFNNISLYKVSSFTPTCFSPIGPSSESTMCLVFEVANSLIIGVVPACMWVFRLCLRSLLTCLVLLASSTRHVNNERRHNLNTHMHAGTTPIIRLLATSKTRHIVLSEDGPIGLKHVGVNDDTL